MWRHRLRISGMIRNEILRTGNNFCQQVNESVGFSTLKPCSGSPERKAQASLAVFLFVKWIKAMLDIQVPNTARKFKFTQISSWQIWCKKVKTTRKLKAKMVNTAFVYRFIWGCKFVVKCGIYHLCPWFSLSLHFFAPYLHEVRKKICLPNFSFDHLW